MCFPQEHVKPQMGLEEQPLQPRPRDEPDLMDRGWELETERLDPGEGPSPTGVIRQEAGQGSPGPRPQPPGLDSTPSSLRAFSGASGQRCVCLLIEAEEIEMARIQRRTIPKIICHVFKKFWFLLVRSGIRDQDLGPGCVRCYLLLQ